MAVVPLAQSIPLFAVGAAVLVVGGVLLARAADEIAERTGMGKLLAGVLLLSVATSLPEVVTTVSASVADAPDLAVGDLFGAGMANMATLAVVDLLHRGQVWPRVELGHARIAGVAISLTALAALALSTPDGPVIGWVGADTIVIASAYVAAIAWLRRSPTGRVAGEVLPAPTGWTGEGATLRGALWRFAAATLLIFVSAPAVAFAGREIASETGIGETFVGGVFVAISTALPELVASVAAIRIGAHDLAVGNLFGSNALNIAILVVADTAYTRGPLLAAVDPGQIVPAIGSVLLMAMALTAIVHGRETRIGRLEPDAVLLLLAYAGALFAVWTVRP